MFGLKKVKIFGLILLLCLTFVSGCGQDKTKAQPVVFDNLKTFDEATGAEVCNTCEEVGNIKFVYQINNKEDKKISEYKSDIF